MEREHKRPRNERYVGREPGFQGQTFEEDEAQRERDRQRVAERQKKRRRESGSTRDEDDRR